MKTSTLSADELVLLVDAVQDYAIFLLSPAGEIRSWNRGAAQAMGYTADEALGCHFSMFYPPADKAIDKPGNELKVAARDGRVEDEGWRVRKDGKWFWANTVITALRGPAGDIRGFAKITRDLSERRAAEERLRHSEEMFRLLVLSVKDYAIFMLDANGIITTWNAGAEGIKGYTPGEIIGRHFSIFYPEEEIRAGKPERELETARTQGSMEDEGWRLRKDGSRFWANVIITAVFDESGELRGFAKVTRDITEKKQAEETQRALLEQREARLIAEEERRRVENSYRISQEANRAKDEFLMTLSHELRTPMTAILGWARLLPNMAPEDPLFREAVASISRGAQLQARLIDDVLDVSRIISGKLRLSREQIDVARVIAAAIETVKPTADAKRITITAALSALGTIVGDATRLQQVVWNLLTNAIKFTPKQGTITVSARRAASQLQISVTDSGEGIDPSFLPHVFEPFRQAENPSTRTHGGLGLGLSIVRYIVEAHGGTVSASSKGRGHGATFTVSLPIGALQPAVVDPQTPLGIPVDRALPPNRLRNVSILVVEDDNEARDMIAAVLRQSGASVIAVESAAAAREQLAQIHPRVILTDIGMPVQNGYQFARELRADPAMKDVKLVALTAFATVGRPDRSDFDRYLSKPIDPADLIDEVAAVVAG